MALGAFFYKDAECRLRVARKASSKSGLQLRRVPQAPQKRRARVLAPVEAEDDLLPRQTPRFGTRHVNGPAVDENELVRVGLCAVAAEPPISSLWE